MDQRVEASVLGKRLKRWRDAQDLSGPEAAEKLSAQSGTAVDWAQLRQFEQGEEVPSDALSEALATLYGHAVSELLDATPDEPVVEAIPDDRPDSIQLRSPYRPSRPTGEQPVEGGWDIGIGEEIRRTDLHRRFGGGRQGGISPSRKSANVLVFSDPEAENAHGFVDRWENDLFLYCGEGQTGDQELVRGNAAILRHRRDKRSLRLFEGTGSVVRYAGRFEIDLDVPYVREKSEGADSRRVIMFRLTPVVA